MLIQVRTNMSSVSSDKEICPSVFAAIWGLDRSPNIDGPGYSIRGKSLIVLRREQHQLDVFSHNWPRRMVDITT